MKKILFLILLFGITASPLMAQKRIRLSKVPPIIITNFTAKFAAVKKVKWRKEESLYFASFMQNDKGIDVTYQSTGDWVETVSEIDIKDLPEAVVKGVHNLFTLAKLKEAAKVEGADKKTLYIVELKFKGRKVEMTLDEQGNQVS